MYDVSAAKSTDLGENCLGLLWKTAFRLSAGEF